MGRPALASSVIGADFGSIVSRYWMSWRSSMRPPRSEIEPLRCEVSTVMRGEAATAASRACCCSGGVGAPGTGGVVGETCAPGWPVCAGFHQQRLVIDQGLQRIVSQLVT